MADQDERTKLIGRKSEHYFKGICINASVTPTRPEYDENGWDFILELPREIKPLIYRDIGERHTKCLVQVKSTDDFSNRRYSLTMTNWEHLTQTLMPCFVFIVDFQGKMEPQQTFMCHINENRIGEVLKRLRKLSVENISDFNHRKMQLIATDDENCSYDNYDEILKDIKKYINGSIDNYINRKSLIIRTIGFENGSHLLQITSIATAKQFTNALLGVGQLQITKAKIYETRFGISAGERHLQIGEMTIAPVVAGVCTIQLSRPGSHRITRIEGTAYITPIGLHRDLKKLRVARKSFDLLISKDEFELKYDIKLTAVYSIRELAEDLEFLIIMSQRKSTVELVRDGKRFCIAQSMQDVHIDKGILTLKKVVDSVRKILNDYNISDNLEVNIQSLNSQPQDLSWYVYASTREKLNLSMQIERQSQQDLPRTNGLLANPVVLRGVEKSIILLAYWKAKISVVKNRVSCSVYEPTIFDVLQTIHTDKDDDLLVERISEFDACCKNLAGGTLINRSLTFEKT